MLDTDNSPPSALSVLPRVIEKNKRTVIAHAKLDMVLIMNGTLVSQFNPVAKNVVSRNPRPVHRF